MVTWRTLAQTPEGDGASRRGTAGGLAALCVPLAPWPSVIALRPPPPALQRGSYPTARRPNRLAAWCGIPASWHGAARRPSSGGPLAPLAVMRETASGSRHA